MTPRAKIQDEVDLPASGRFGWVLVAVAVLCLVAAGGLMWWRQGDAVFGSLVTAALAWCF